MLASTAPIIFPADGVVAGTAPSVAVAAVAPAFAGGELSPTPFLVLPSSIVRAASGEGGFAAGEASPCALVAPLSVMLSDVAGAPTASGAAAGDGLFATGGSAVAACGGATSGAGSLRGAPLFAADGEPGSGS
ncbi:MAG: hypothetical protein JOZ66_17130 [Hyphomicrobiales bacterium]|nr:hypothetical protein [Hyphomicrobiales bacterium]MBV8766634.1 hypothetical protein [Hyphomicrobiales bacterium]